MTDYSDHRKWVEVKLWKQEFYFQQYEEYSPEQVKEVLDDLIKRGQDEGLEGCFLKFQSNMEPYEDYTGPPSVCVAGYRRLNAHEISEIERQDNISALAKEKGITFYEANVLFQLQERGKV